MHSRRALRLFYQGLYLLRCATNDTLNDTTHSPRLLLGMLLDDLYDAEMMPDAKLKASSLCR